MKKKCILFLFFIYSPFVFSCKEYVSGEIICELNEGDKKLSIQFLKKGCEFPKGNKTDCLYAKSCLNGEVKIGTAIYTNQNSSKDFCLTAKKDKEKLYKSLFSGEKNLDVVLDCSRFVKEGTNVVTLTLDKKKHKCNLDKVLGRIN